MVLVKLKCMAQRNEWMEGRDFTDAGRAFQSTMVRGIEDRRSTGKDQFERTRHKMCCHQLNDWLGSTSKTWGGNTSQTVKTLAHEWQATVSSTIREGLAAKLRNERRHRCRWSVVSFNMMSSSMLHLLQLFTITNKVGIPGSCCIF